MKIKKKIVTRQIRSRGRCVALTVPVFFPIVRAFLSSAQFKYRSFHGKNVFPVGKKLDQLNVNKHVPLILDP